MANRKKVMLITGAAGGIGRAVVALFAEKGWRVVGVDRAEFGADFPADGLFIQADISEPQNIELIYQKTAEFSPVLDAVVNNAGVQIGKPLLKTTAEEWDRTLASNLRSVFLGTKLAHPLLKAAGGGAIVNMSSVHAIATSANIAAYAASKGGLLAFTRAVAIEFAADNIRVNAVLPGAVDTPMLRASMQRGHFDADLRIQKRLDTSGQIRRSTGRVGTPREIAQAIYFLADGDQSSFMTGQALVVDGGATAKLSTE